MIAIAFAAVSALSYGAADFSGALASKENDATVVTAAVQVASLLALIGIVIVFPQDELRAVDLGWGAVGGLGAAFGLVTFYKALAIGPMSVAASLTALWSTTVPVAAGLLLGERPGPITLAGIAVAVPAGVLVSLGGSGDAGTELTPRERTLAWQHQTRTRRLAVAAGFGFGLFFVALSRTSPDAGLYPLLGARVASIAALAAVILRGRIVADLAIRWWPVVIVAGLLDCAANSFYLLALRHGSLTWVAAISSLYPISTVLLARLVLSERLARVQFYGIGAAGLALVLFGIGA